MSHCLFLRDAVSTLSASDAAAQLASTSYPSDIAQQKWEEMLKVSNVWCLAAAVLDPCWFDSPRPMALRFWLRTRKRLWQPFLRNRIGRLGDTCFVVY